MRFSSQCFLAVMLLLCVGVFSACSHYRLGSGGNLPFRTIYIAPVENAANIPQGAAIFSAQLRDGFVRDGRLSVVNSAAAADVTLTVTLERYTRNMTTSRADDSGLARKFDLTVLAVCTLQGANDGKVYFEKRPVSSTRQIFTTPTFDARQSDQLQAEYNAMPLLASSLANGVTHAVLDVW
ncbi:hypothetical protein M2447_001625 [Ereboglobus sp. PH5-10]|uniref:LPS assembly lipoprotein LptE n=1 Tax=Ereboglobus sp. PH5-10 TaxID=2940629 RepID=UPI002406C599|nr:LPS assembly lipoprotein LptE [Ereboglobus sp. PH5-10]MDF9827527.1 hypothetical protein [Ereboglobus sp. PH5-10]